MSVPRYYNDFSYWFPKVENCGIPVPRTFYAKLPDYNTEPELAERLDKAFYMDNIDEDMQVIRYWLNRDIIPKLKELNMTGWTFVKNACYSGKFNANRMCNNTGLDNLAQAIANINYDALICGADGLDEIVIRDYIYHDHSKTPCIYNGLPFRSEFRVFYDFDKKKPIFTANYWDFDYCYPHLKDITDKIIFEHERERIERSFLANKEQVEALVAEAMKNVEGLEGQWSVDILIDETGKNWLIDMAVAQHSAYWENRPDKDEYPE